MEAYADLGFDGPIRPDHVPTMTSEKQETASYEMWRRLFPIGYIRSLIDAVYEYDGD